MIELTKDEARKIALHGQFDFNVQTDIASIIDHLGYVQIDSISVVERAHHHVLWSRYHEYRNLILTRLQEHPRQVFEYWSHAAAYLPLHLYRYSLPRMKRVRDKGFDWFPIDKKAMALALETIEREGPKQAKDFKAPESRKGTGWWDWKPMKIALEYLFHEGNLMVVTRKNFQKVYDLPERVLPAQTDSRMPTDHEMATYLIVQALRALGIVSEKDIGYQRKEGTAKIKTVLAEKIENKEITKVSIPGVNRSYYVQTPLLEQLVVPSVLPNFSVRILSPFDNLVINRLRLTELFDFDYQLECYTPKEKRVYGYFSLLILYDHRFIGIVDAKAERKDKKLVVNHLHISHMPGNTDLFLHALAQELEAYARFNGCTHIEIDRVFPEKVKTAIASYITLLQ